MVPIATSIEISSFREYKGVIPPCSYQSYRFASQVSNKLWGQLILGIP